MCQFRNLGFKLGNLPYSDKSGNVSKKVHQGY